MLIEPLFVERVWGGRRLVTDLFPDHQVSSANIGEVWVLCEDSSILNGHYAGCKIKDIWSPFPLIIKWLRAEDWLSVQIHPDDECASLLEGEGVSGKTEAWYVTQSEVGGKLIWRLKEGVSKEEFLPLQGSDILTKLRYQAVKEGDSLVIDSGTIHALGPGVTVLEVQQNSHITYRLYDWDRLGLDGKPRQLHREKANYVLDKCYNVEPIKINYEYLYPVHVGQVVAETAYFCQELLPKKEQLSWSIVGEGEFVVSLSGKGILELNGESVEIKTGYACILPAGPSSVVVKDLGDLQLMRIVLPLSC